MSEAAIAEPPKSVRQDLQVGGKYTAVDNGDGTFDILDVCVFAEIPAGVKRNADAVGREWQEAAVLKNKAREAEGHLPPVHIYHTDETTVKPVYAGKMRLKTVRQIVYEGKKLWATFASILGVPADVFAKIRRGFLPYRSVEIHNWDKPEIDSLALMDTDVPFFRMPMLSVGSILQRDAEVFMAGSRPVEARRLGKKAGGLILFKFTEGRAMEDEDEDKKKKDPASGLDAAPKAGETEKAAEADSDEKAEGKLEDEGATKEKPEAILDEPEEDEDAAPESDTNGAVMAALQSIGTLLQQVLERLGPKPPSEEKLEPVNGVHLGQEAMGQDFKAAGTNDTNVVVNFEEKDKMADPKATPAPLDQEALLMRVAEAAVLKATGPLMAELNKFKAEQAEVAKKAAVKARFDAAVQELTDNGQVVSPELSAHLLKSADHGDEFLKEQVIVFKASLPKEPPADADTFEATLAGQAQAGDESDAVNAFCAKNGPQHAAFAQKQMAAFRNWQADGGSDITAEEWLSTNFRSHTMGQRNKV